ncbi:MAG TPA: hypothetical protein VFL04_05970, partial [Rectinemataceae bacterium]|nr:hypothetical protein [Rectinemataceae bacterium]
MKKKLIIVLLLVLVLGSSTYAQLVLGVSGALRADSTMSASSIASQYKSGQNIFYGPFVEIIFGKLGLGVSGNFSFFEDLGTKFMDYDVDGYVSYHLFGGRAFLDPFGELGLGLMAYNYANSSDNPSTNDSPISGNYYWFGGFGLGLNLGPIGIFGKMDYNFRINGHLQGKDDFGNSYDIPYYG